jgi:energy-coupling factor transport system ATP-binding protein
VVLSLSDAVYLGGMLPVVLIVTAVNTVVTQLLYFPAYRVFSEQTNGAVNEEERK